MNPSLMSFNTTQQDMAQQFVLTTTSLLAPKLTNKAQFVEIPSLEFDDELEDEFCKVGLHFKEIEVNEMKHQRNSRFHLHPREGLVHKSVDRQLSESPVSKSGNKGILKQYRLTTCTCESHKSTKQVRFSICAKSKGKNRYKSESFSSRSFKTQKTRIVNRSMVLDYQF